MSRRQRRVTRLAWALSGLHAALVAAGLVARVATWGAASAAAQLAPQWAWLVLGAVASVSCAAGRRWWPGAANLALAGVSAVWLGGLCLGRPVTPKDADAATTLRVLVWNVGDRVGRAPELERVIEAQSPDLICLCEAQRLQWERRFLEGWPRVVVSDVGLFTQLPVLRAEEVGYRGESGRYRSWLSCSVQTAGGPLEVLVAHVVGRPAERSWAAVVADPVSWLGQVGVVQREQAALLEQCLPPEGRPSLLAGDLNSPPAALLHQRLAGRMTDAYAATSTGLGLTFVARGRVPLWRLDYVWCGGGVRPLRSRVLPRGPSDHRPVVVEVALPGPAG